MAKGHGSTRASKWAGDIYTVNGVRKNYDELPDDMKDVILKKYKEISKEIRALIGGQSVEKEIGEGKTAKIYFTTDGIEHFCRDAMVILSGKYFSHSSMLNIKSIFEQSTLIEGGLLSYHPEKPHDIYFKYTDNTGRDVYFKAKKNKAGLYYLYSVVDQ